MVWTQKCGDHGSPAVKQIWRVYVRYVPRLLPVTTYCCGCSSGSIRNDRVKGS